MNDSADRRVVVFTEAIQLPEQQRAKFLDHACGGDEELRRDIETLLQEFQQVGDFLEKTSPARGPKVNVETSGAEKAGDYINGYKLLKQIGEGGCGVVFMAEQSQPVHRKVALKIIKPGMDTKSVIARFEAERQVLALMDHPNIAKIFDAGATASGRPYFVMELVQGIKITEYCDQHALTTDERLELFVQVCHAIQHAHQKGIIHRDIKPSNILVTPAEAGPPLPIVIDFGVAKATTNQSLTDKTLFTALEMLIGTPAYMSPEQAAFTSVDVDTRTDIYSLGVLLYELLTGTTPFDTKELLKAGLDEVRRVIREVEPVQPSTRLRTTVGADLVNVAKQHGTEAPRLIRKIRGDLDWIVMKALEKDPARRYATANGFAMDVGRYLASEAILARPPSAAYKFRKLIARNKLVFTGVALIFILLFISLIATTRWLMAERQTQKDMRQELEINRLESLSMSLYYDAKYAEAEQMIRKAFALSRQSNRAEFIPVIYIRMLIAELAQQKKFDQIRPVLDDFVDPALLSKPEYKELHQYKELYFAASQELARQGKWKDAAALAENLVKSDPADANGYHMLAPLLVAEGGVEEYRRLCGEIISRFRNATNPGVADKMAKDCLILPNSGTDLISVAALADVAVTHGSNSSSAPHFKFCKALAEYRLGHYQATTNWAGLAIQSSYVYPKANAAAVMAMSQFKLNQLDNARTALAYCNNLIKEKMPKFGDDLGEDWPDWIIARTLQSEAKGLIEGKPPTLSDSADPPR